MEEKERAIRTMKSDADELTQREQSFIDLVAEEAKLREADRPPIRIGTGKKKGGSKLPLISALVVALALAAGGIYFFILGTPQQNQKPSVPAGPIIPRPIVNAQEAYAITIEEGDRTGLLEELGEGLTRAKGDTSFWYLPILVRGKGILAARDFFKTLRISVPSEGFWTGTGSGWNLFAYGEDFVFIFEVAEKNKVHGAMLAWERILPQQLSIILRGVSTVGNFEDKIIKNIDVRVGKLETVAQQAVSWGVVSEKFLVITTSEKALRAAIDRLVIE